MRRSAYQIIFRSFFLSCVLLISQQAFCWGVLGHRVIGQIAEEHLTKKAKKELRKLIGKETLALWSNWADFIKSDSTWDHVSPWHYVNVPGHLPKEKFMEVLKNIPGKSLYSQIPAMMTELKDKSLPLEQRKRALIFLVHFVGDLHQPLHVGRPENLGGNRVVVYWFDRKTNLHTVWDSILMEFQQYSYTEYSKLLDIASKEDMQQWAKTSLEDCFYESYSLADMIYDATPAESKLGYDYNFKFQKIMDHQLLKGGIRLAAMLNEVFD